VPGYVAPAETAVPVVRMSVVMIRILQDGVAGGRLVAAPDDRVGATLSRELAQLVAGLDLPELPASVMARGFTAWASLFGVISFELFGHSVGITDDYDALFEQQLVLLNELVGVGTPVA